MKTKLLFFKVKTYKELTKDELYALLKLRAEVFIVEQDCIYQDIDGKDDKALHVLGYIKDKLIAYTRVFPPETYFEQASIGRVVVLEKERENSYGFALMEKSVQAVKENYNTAIIKISAQVYLKKFYNKLGFQEKGNEYLEDGIPHIRMIHG